MKAVTAIFLTWAMLATGIGAADTLTLESESDRINYSVGYQVGGDFRRQGVELVPEALLQGIRDATSGESPRVTPEEMNSTLVELKKRILASQQQEERRKVEAYRGEGRAFLAANAGQPGVVVLPSGLQYQVLKAGTGRSPSLQDEVTVHYRGTRLDGSEFDSSYRRGEPATFRLDGVIRGWSEALPRMKEGARWKLFVPADLAFGERGPLADQTVIYEIELITVHPGGEKGAGGPS